MNFLSTSQACAFIISIESMDTSRDSTSILKQFSGRNIISIQPFKALKYFGKPREATLIINHGAFSRINHNRKGQKTVLCLRETDTY